MQNVCVWTSIVKGVGGLKAEEGGGWRGKGKGRWVTDAK